MGAGQKYQTLRHVRLYDLTALALFWLIEEVLKQA